MRKVLSHEQNINKAYTDELKEKIATLQTDNTQLISDKAEIEVLLNEAKEKCSQAVVLHTELSSENVFSNAEKLKVL